jgi:hypothetical protein
VLNDRRHLLGRGRLHNRLLDPRQLEPPIAGGVRLDAGEIEVRSALLKLIHAGNERDSSQSAFS